jgi:thiol-disulfide isomerase/thioredoxin
VKAVALFGALLLGTSLTAAELPELKNADAVKRVVRESPRTLRVLNLWATWCAPCVAEMADLRTISEQFAEIELIGVSLDDAIPGDRNETKKKVARFLQQRQIRYRNFYFTGSTNDLATALNFEGELPITFIYDANKKELARIQGMIDRKDLAARLNTFLKGKRR